MDGLFLIDKPRGLTSHDVVRAVRRLLKTRRVGHTGTLDPMATGVLPVAVGDGTRLVQFLMAGDKSYRATLKLGEDTETYDAEGAVTSQRPVPDFSETQICAACQSFVGEIDQIPPMFSAIKKDGVALHRLARQGIEIEREARRVTISRIDVLEVRLPFVTLEIDCSKGTYIRSLAYDLGQVLGTGAHLTELRRTRNGFFTEKDCVELAALQAMDISEFPVLSPLDALRGFPLVNLSSEAAKALGFGIPPALSGLVGECKAEPGDVVGLVYENRLAALARFAPERQKERRGDFELIRVLNPSNPE